MATDRSAMAEARAAARELAGAGAQAVWLAGSHARGDAVEHSDIDIGVIATAGAGPGYRLHRRGGYLLSVSWTTAEATRASFRDPALLGAAVPGWRRAVLLHDPDGVAAALQRDAVDWRWDGVAEACDGWVAEQVTGYAEEVHKLVAALGRGDPTAAAVQRSVLALRLAVVLSVHRRLLYDSENWIYRVVAEEMGEPWAATQAAALCLDGQPATESVAAALTLYALAAEEARELLDERQRDVVSHALAICTTL